MTVFKLNDLNLRFRKLQSCISKENRGTDPASKERLSEFLKLNPYDLNYTVRLDGLLDQMPRGDGLRENILLEKIKRVDDLERRSQMLSELAEQYPDRDSAVEARYELGLITIQLWKKSELPLSEKMPLLIKAQRILRDIAEQPGGCPYSQQATAALQTLPQIKLEAPAPQ